MTDDETSLGGALKREQPVMTSKENAILFISIVCSFLVLTVIDLQLSQAILNFLHIQVSYGTNLVVLAFILVETYLIYRIVKLSLITKKKEKNLAPSSNIEDINRDSKETAS